MSSTSAPADGLPAAPAPSSGIMSVLQRIGRSLMMPIAVLPAAGILLRLGQDDLLGASENAFLDKVAAIFAAAGGALFDNLPLLFAIGVAIGFARRADGSTALAALVGYLVFHRVTMTIFTDSSIAEKVNTGFAPSEADPNRFEPVLNLAAANPTGVLGGITIGLMSALLWQRYYRTKLPAWLAFFGGRRFVPIVTAFAAVIVGVIFGYVWPVIGGWLTSAGEGLASAGGIGAGIYGLINRLLIPLGLHHFVNSIIWTVIPEGTTPDGAPCAGDLICYQQGAQGFGGFEAGFFPVMMFGLPAAAIAIWRTALPHRRAAIGGIMLSAALTSFVTGITEPIEFAFIFVAPVLFIAHAVLTGISEFIVYELGGRLGFTFSAGGIDMLLFGTKDNTRGLGMIIIVGLVYAVVYYVLFTFLIRRLNLATPGREPEDVDVSGAEATAATGPAPTTTGSTGSTGTTGTPGGEQGKEGPTPT
ncbi:MAG: PTS sugar transporter subunit IIA [Streptosporangiales bacterium]|nr:PTS sugar transporter subunit IIA [Streptosporangiales bacterium]